MSWAEFWITGAVTMAALLLIYVLTAPFRRPKKVEEPKKKTFLEEALEADPDRPRPARAYTWAEFQKDLHDGSMTFEEIYEKYGGIFPKKPEPPAAPPEGSPDTQALQGADGGLTGVEGAAGPNGGPGVAGASGVGPPDRMAQLQEWFQQRGKEGRLQGLVPPPPAPHTVIHKIYTRGRR